MNHEPTDWSEDQLRRELAPQLEVIRLLGKGTMASVFLARDTELKRRVAIKVLRPRVARNPTARVRFGREAQSAARISHPHVASVFSVGRLSNDVPYIVMEYVRGRTLAEHMEATGRQDPAEVRRILREVASALAAAHEKSVVHRDVRPGNVLYEEGTGKTLLTDFGLVALMATDEQEVDHLTQTGEIVGHPDYMSPEQLAGEKVTEESDVYALGMLGYELLAARPRSPDKKRMPAARMWSNRTRIAELRDDVPPWLEALIYRCLAEKPTHRPTASDVERELLSPTPSESGPTEVVEVTDTSTIRGLIKEMNRRNVFSYVGPVGGAAGVVISMYLDANGYARRPILLSIPLFMAVLATTAIVAWFHGQRGPQRVTRYEVVLLSGVLFAWLAVSLLVMSVT